MIFVALGSHHQSFERLVQAVEALEDSGVVVQHGHSRRPENVAGAVDFMDLPELLQHVERARIVIIHAGVGTVLAAIQAGHVPIVVPRQKRYNEHVDDHQAELARALDSSGHAIAVWDMADLADAVASVPPRDPPSENYANGVLGSALAATIKELIADRSGSRRRARPKRSTEAGADAVGDVRSA